MRRNSLGTRSSRGSDKRSGAARHSPTPSQNRSNPSFAAFASGHTNPSSSPSTRGTAPLKDPIALNRSRFLSPIITACQGGPMGALAAQALKHRGFTRVAYVDGGTQAWLDAGYPTER